MSAKADDAALLTQVKEENVGRRKIDRKDGLVFKLSDYNPRTAKPSTKRKCGNALLQCATERLL